MPDTKNQQTQMLMYIAFVLLLGYVFFEVWSFYAKSQRNYREQSELLQELYGPETLLIHIDSVQAQNPSGQPLTTVATVSSSKFDIEFARFEPISQEVVKIWFENASYEKIIRWISQMEYDEGVQTNELNIERGQESGTVSGQVELSLAK